MIKKVFLKFGSLTILTPSIMAVVSCSTPTNYENIKWKKLLSNWQESEGFKTTNNKEIKVQYLGYYLADFKNFDNFFKDKNLANEYNAEFKKWLSLNTNTNGSLKLKGIWRSDRKIPKYKGIAKLFYVWAKTQVVYKGKYKEYSNISNNIKKPIFDSIFNSIYTIYNRVQVQSSEATGGYSTMNEFYWNNRAKFWGDLKKWAKLYNINAFEERNPVEDPSKPVRKFTNKFKGSKDLLNIIKYSLNSIVDEKFYYNGQQQYVNWWFYEIGFPRIIFDFVLPIRDSISTSEANKYMSGYTYFKPNPLYGREAPTAINAYKPANKMLSTGANLADDALNALKASILIHDKEKFKFSISVINDYIFKRFVSSGDGFYRDGGFIQHSNIPYIGTYGSVLLKAITKVAYILHGSGLELFKIQPKIGNIFPIIEKSVLPFIYRGVMTSTIGGRGITRDGSEFLGAELIESISMIEKFAPKEYKEKFQNFLAQNINQLNNDIQNLPIDSAHSKNDLLKKQWEIYKRDKYISKWIGKKYDDILDYSTNSKEYGTHQIWSIDRVNINKGDYMASFSFHSSRIGNFEGMNGENLQGMYQGDGLSLIQTKKDANAYTSQYWWGVNPYRLPGTTSDSSTKKRTDKGPNNHSYDEWRDYIDHNAGKSLLGYSGGTEANNISSMFGVYSNFDEKLRTKKSVFVLENQIVVLGKTNNWDLNGNISTTIDNRMGGRFLRNNDKFIFNGDNGDKIGYKVLSHINKVKLDQEQARPAWMANRRYYGERKKPKKAFPTQKKFNSIRLQHDSGDNSDFGYIVAPSIDNFDQLDSLNSRVKIIENNSSRQAIEYTDLKGEEYLMVNFLSKSSGTGKYNFLYSPLIKDKLLKEAKGNAAKINEINKNANVEIKVDSPASLIFKRRKLNKKYIYNLWARSANYDKSDLKINFNKKIVGFSGPFKNMLLDDQTNKPYYEVEEAIGNLKIKTQWAEKTRIPLADDNLFFTDPQSFTLHFDSRYKFNNSIKVLFELGE